MTQGGSLKARWCLALGRATGSMRIDQTATHLSKHRRLLKEERNDAQPWQSESPQGDRGVRTRRSERHRYRCDDWPLASASLEMACEMESNSRNRLCNRHRI